MWLTIEAGHRVSPVDDLNDDYDPAEMQAKLADLHAIGMGKLAIYEGDIRDPLIVEQVGHVGSFRVVPRFLRAFGVQPQFYGREAVYDE